MGNVGSSLLVRQLVGDSFKLGPSRNLNDEKEMKFLPLNKFAFPISEKQAFYIISNLVLTKLRNK